MSHAISLWSEAATAPLLSPGGAVARADFTEIIVFLAIIIGSAIYNWIQSRKTAEESDDSPGTTPPHALDEEPSTSTPPSRQQPRPQSSHWEEELRRMLELDQPREPTRPPPPPPTPARAQPVLIEEPRRVQPPAIPKSSVPTPRPPTVIQPGADRPTSARERMKAMQRDLQARAERTAAAAGAVHRSAKSARTAKLFKQVAPSHTQHSRGEMSTHRPRRSQTIATTVQLFQNPQGARQAILASLILGPPKSMEETSIP
ncbi:MAG TPA: hypothetical protein VMS21_06515 [Methylomirabilota bacterium]|nr:hypothetical protein [Methylomirabilota bacterium]